MEKINYLKMVDDLIEFLGEEHKNRKILSEDDLQVLGNFYVLRNKYVMKSIGNMIEKEKAYQEYKTKCKSGILNAEKSISNPNILTMIEDMLESDAFDLTNSGTQYLKCLIEILYHERELYYADVSKEQEKIKVDYFNLADFSNVHYKMLGVPKEKAITDMILTIYNNEYECGYSISDVVYRFTDNLIYCNSNDRKNVKRKRFSK